MSRARSWTWASCALAAAVSLASCHPAGSPALDIATTSSVQNSGLLDALLPAYQDETGIAVRVHAAGSGRALQMMAEGLVQLVISHAPEAEARALQQHPDWTRLELAHNQFIIAGPPSDLAGVLEAADAVDAFRRIAQSSVPFVSRGDLSGTHERENALWKAADVRPPAERLLISGRGMALALRHADQVRGYTLSDEATYSQFERELELQRLYEGDPRLLNTYAVIYPRAEVTASHLADWLVGDEGRARIGGFTIGGQPMFQVPASRH